MSGQHRPGQGNAVKSAMIDSSDDDLSLPCFKISALTNALLDGENWQQNADYSPQSFHKGHDAANRIGDIGERGERQSNLEFSRSSPQQRQSFSASGYLESNDTRPRRLVRIITKPLGPHGAYTPRESPRISRLSEIFSEHSQADGSTSPKLVTPSHRFDSSVPKPTKFDRSGSGYKEMNSGQQTGGGGSGSSDILEPLLRNQYALRHNISTVPRTRKITGVSLLGQARRFKRTQLDELSPGDEMICASATGGAGEPEQDIIRRLESQSGFYSGVEVGVHMSEDPRMLSCIRDDMENFDSMSPTSRRLLQSDHQGRPDLRLDLGKENDHPPTALPPLEQHIKPGHTEKQTSTPNFSSPQRKALDVLEINTHLRAPPPPPKMSVLQMATKAAGAATANRKKRVYITINGNAYQRLECIGRGGSCRVYRVMSENYKMWALKKVSLADIDEQAVKGFKGEIDLLKKLEKVERVVQIRDWEVNEVKQTLSVLMELGEIDLDTVIKRHTNGEHAKFDSGFTNFYWKEMLECVAAVHQHDVVHSDLKPANFLLVKGSLKLIDFGIANVIQDDTVNVHREHQVGTPNFMAPEALTFANAHTLSPNGEIKVVKLGKPSDIWGLGCILYLMVYGKAPFAHCNGNLQKAMLITNPLHIINYPSTGIGGVCVPLGCIRTLKACLAWDQFQRPDIETLLSESDQMLLPRYESETKAAISPEQLGAILQSVIKHCRQSGVPTDQEVATWHNHFYDKIKLGYVGDTG